MICSQNRKLLDSLYLAESRKKYPAVPDFARPGKKFSDSGANELEKTIVFYIDAIGGSAERVKNMGRVIKDTTLGIGWGGEVIGKSKPKYIPGTGKKGTADISAIVHGLSFKIEVKIGRDSQSEKQREYQAKTERAGGIYQIAKGFDSWLSEFNEILINADLPELTHQQR